MRWPVSIIVVCALTACTTESTEYPRDTRINYQVVAPSTRDESTAHQIRPTEQPAQLATATKTVTLPARVMVANNNIFMLERPWSGAKRGEKPYRAGTIFTGEKVAGEWVYVRDVLTTGWIHKDNLRPLAR